MPEYKYECTDCKVFFPVIKRVADIDEVEVCTKCNTSDNTIRRISLVNFERSSAMIEPYYEPGLGCIIKSKSQKAQVMKKLGVEEIGNTDPDKMYNELEKPREKKIAASWNDV